MEQLLAALGHPTRFAIVEHLLGLDEDPPASPRQSTHAAMRERLRINGGTLSKDLQRLREARVLAVSPGPRADQQLYGVRQHRRLLELLRCAADLDAAIARELAELYNLEADIKADVAERLSKARP